MNTGILIIGGGIIGLSIARELHKFGSREITLVDRADLGREASWAAAGMLAPNAETEAIDDFYHFCSASNALYPQFAGELFEETGIDIEFRQTGTLELAFDDSNAEHLAQKYERQNTAKINVQRLTRKDVLGLEPTISPMVVSGLHYPNDGHVENRKIIDALVAYSRNHGLKVRENTAVSELIEEDGRIVGARTETGPIFAGDVILATGAWTSLIKFGKMPSPFDVRPIRGQMLCFRGFGRSIGKVIYGAGAYLVPRADGRVLVGATVEDGGFVKVVTDTGVERLRRSAISTLPLIEKMTIADSWCGLRPFAADGLPIIGGIDGLKGLFMATAHYRNGILLAPVTAKIVADLVLNGESSQYMDHFTPNRFARSLNSTAF